MGAFDLKPLLEDFFTSGVLQPNPAQLLDGEAVLYRSSDWRAPTGAEGPVVARREVVLDAARWTLQMQPGATRVVQTLSWFNVLLIGLSAIAGGGVTVIVWILAARTWILQRAVVRRTAALRRTSERLRQLATTDELTGLYNRRFFLNRWELEWERAKRYERPLACLMIDVNGFKQVNDRLGHAAGDSLLTRVAQELKTMLRQSDLLARFGGDEFVIALPETTLAQATAVAEKLRQVRIEVPDGASRGVSSVTLSVGVSRIQADTESSKEVLEAADESLYAWKRKLASSPR
jgi:diguanylate cyclase (GGDEF)-like protein